MDDDLPDDLDPYAADYFGLKKGDIELISKACDEFFDKRGMPRGRGLFEETNQKFFLPNHKQEKVEQEKRNEPNKNKRRKNR